VIGTWWRKRQGDGPTNSSPRPKAGSGEVARFALGEELG
jgi:hypothetical protein